MASLTKEYKNRKFKVFELSNLLKKMINTFNIKPNTTTIRYSFVIDGIEDKKELTSEQLEFMTELTDDSVLSFFLGDRTDHYIVLRPHKNLSNEERLSISMDFPTVEELKNAFSVLETELKFKNPQDPQNKVAPTTNSKEVLSETSDKIVDPPKKTSIKHLKKEYKKEYGPIRIFKEDVVSIIKLFQKSYTYCEIEVDEYTIESEFDIDKVKDEISKNFTKNLIINGTNTKYGLDQITLRLNMYGAKLIVRNDEDFEAMGLLNKIDPIISKRENKILKYTSSIKNLIIIAIITFIVAVVLIILIKSYTDNKFILDSSNIIITAIGFIPLFICIINTLLTYNKHSIIYLVNSDEKQGFMAKNKETITVGVLTTVIGGILLALLIKVFGFN